MKLDSIKGAEFDLFLFDLIEGINTTLDLQELEDDLHKRVSWVIQTYSEEIGVDYIGVM